MDYKLNRYLRKTIILDLIRTSIVRWTETSIKWRDKDFWWEFYLVWLIYLETDLLVILLTNNFIVFWLDQTPMNIIDLFRTLSVYISWVKKSIGTMFNHILSPLNGLPKDFSDPSDCHKRVSRFNNKRLLSCYPPQPKYKKTTINWTKK